MGLFHISDELTHAHAEHGAGVVVLTVSGEIDWGASPLLRTCILDRIDAGHRQLVLDFSAVTFIDSTAIGVLVGAVKRLAEKGAGRLTVACPPTNERVMRIFDIAGVANLIALYPSRTDALASYATPQAVGAPARTEQAPLHSTTVAELGVPASQPSDPDAAARYAEHAAAGKLQDARSLEPSHEIDELA